jgi:peroxiredoxin Q/BCP
VSHRADLIPPGETAPDFTAEASDGVTVHLAALRGRTRVVLVFYPADNTPGCTAQLCALRDSWASLQRANAAVYGVNPAGAARHAEFAAKHRLPFPLIADLRGKIAEDYGCRALFGLIKRSVYVIDRRGRIVFSQRGTPPTDVILRALQGLQDESPAPG